MNIFDVIVLGGGPGGFAAASVLARRSHRVALVRPTHPPAGPLAESIPPSASRLLDEVGARDALDRGGFVRNSGNTVWWAGGEAHTETFAEPRSGWHVDRTGLEAVLGAVAESAGVTVLDGFTARSANRVDGEGWSVVCDLDGGGSRTLDAPWLVDATGRHGLAARAWRESDRSTTTLALVRRWRSPGGWPDAHAGRTLVESYADGWAWSVPLSGDVRCFTAMVDHRVSDLSGRDVGALLDAEMQKAPHLSALLDGAEPDGDAWACPASLYTSSRFAEPGLLLVGDAGSCIDPLSSYGVKKALASGWLAAVTTHTALVDPPLEADALAFFDAREREVYRQYRRASASFFHEAAQTYGTPYWRTRADAAVGAGGAGPARGRGGSSDPDEAPFPGDADVPEAAVRAAFEALKERPTLDVRRGEDVRTVHRTAIEGLRIVRVDHLATDAYPAGLRYVRGVGLEVMVTCAEGHDDVAALWTRYNEVAPPVSLPDFLTALSTALAAGILVPRAR